jgi:hypothetical protein
MASCILPHYIHRQIYRCMNIYIQTYILYIQTFENPLVHPSSYCIHTYIATLFHQHLRLRLVFLRVDFLLFTFSLFLFLNLIGLKIYNTPEINLSHRGFRLFTIHDNNQFLHYYYNYYRWSVTSNALNVMGRYIVNGARGWYF